MDRNARVRADSNAASGMERLFADLSSRPHLQLAEVQEICFSHGVPDGYRRLFWCLLLGYLPAERDARPAALAQARAQYALFLTETEVSVQATARARASPEPEDGAARRSSARRASPLPEAGAALSPPEMGAVSLPSPAGAASPPQPVGAASPPQRSPEAAGAASPPPLAGVASPPPRSPEAEELLPPLAATPGLASPSTAAARSSPLPHAAVDSPPGRRSAAASPVSPPPTGVHPADALLAADLEMRNQVDRDLERTFPELNFFAKRPNIEAMRRILVTFARLNRGLGYIQGMHELLAPLWYVFAMDAERGVHAAALAAAAEVAAAAEAGAAAAAAASASAESDAPTGGSRGIAVVTDDATDASGAASTAAKADSASRATAAASDAVADAAAAAATATATATAAARADAEADAFRCLSALMCAPFLGGEFRDIFMASSDDTGIGITSVLSRLSALLRRREPALAAHLEGKLQLSPYLYGFRWVSTLLVREFALPDTIIAWDALLSDPARFAFLLHMSVAMLRSQRATLLRADLGAAMRLLRGEYGFPAHCADMRALRAAALVVRAEEAAEEEQARTAAAEAQRAGLAASGSFAALLVGEATERVAAFAGLFRSPTGGGGGGGSAGGRRQALHCRCRRTAAAAVAAAATVTPACHRCACPRSNGCSPARWSVAPGLPALAERQSTARAARLHRAAPIALGSR